VSRFWARFRAVVLALVWVGAAGALGPVHSITHAQQISPAAGKSWASSISTGVKQGVENLGRVFSPKPSTPTRTREDDAISLQSEAKPGARLYVSIARLYTQSNKIADAEQQYRLALEQDADYLPALLGYAQLKERLGQSDEAIRLYQAAVKKHPREASAYNNMGLCHARQGQWDEAVAAMAHAMKLAPQNPRYRNNIAAVLVEQGKFHEAFEHLRGVHTEAAAYYNMGYLLNKKGNTQVAMQHFSMALRTDPTMVPARQWVEHLRQRTAQARLAQHPAAAGVHVISETRKVVDLPAPDRPKLPPRAAPPVPENPRSTMPKAIAEKLPAAPMPRRLPPITSGKPAPKKSPLPGIYYERPADPTAPLPPPMSNAVRPLPRVY